MIGNASANVSATGTPLISNVSIGVLNAWTWADRQLVTVLRFG
jgi:hypothetical protein